MKPGSSPSFTATLALVWFGCFVVALAVPFLLLLSSSIEPPTLLPTLDQISALYAPHLGAVLAFSFALRAKAGRRPQARSGPFIAALLVSAVWNAVVAGTLLLVLVGQMRIEDALSFAAGAGPKLSWLVAPALGYFFAKPGDPA
jgi:hypothetical protein